MLDFCTMMGFPRKVFAYGICAAFTLGGLGGISHAQTVPSAADAGRMAVKPVFPGIDIYDLKREAKPRAAIPGLSPEVAGQEFVLHSLQISGMTAYTEADISPLYQKYLGRKMTVADLYGLLAAIQTRYLEDGYTLSKVSIPAQKIQEGRIVFHVQEGYVDEVEVAPDVPAGPMVSDFAARIRSMRPLNVKALERMMLILNDRPGLRVVSILALHDKNALQASPDAVRLILRNNQEGGPLKPVDGQLVLDNEGSNYTGSGEVTGNLYLNNTGYRLSDLGISLRATTSIQELQQASAAYRLPLWGVSGLVFGLSGSVVHTEPGMDLDELDIMGKSVELRASLNYPLIRQRSENLILETGFNYRNVQTDILGSLLSQDHIRSLDIQGTYGFVDGLEGMNQASLKLGRGFDILDSTKTGTPDLSRQDGRSDFTKVNFTLSRLQPITSSWDILARAEGQYSRTPLLASEEFGVGGSDIGRGYDPSEISGDRGVAFSIETRKTMVFPANSLNLQPFAFWDIGKVWNVDPTDKNMVSASSTGLGVRMDWKEDLSARLVVAKPLTLSPSSPPKYADENGMRVLFRLTNRF